MYRQAVIRHQKAKQWAQALTWAERGVAFYGEDAIRQENADDLRKRIAYVQGKLASPTNARTKPSTRSDSRSTGGASPGIETLICVSCGTTFDRVLTRGRKPKQCPSCRATSSGES